MYNSRSINNLFKNGEYGNPLTYIITFNNKWSHHVKVTKNNIIPKTNLKIKTKGFAL